MRGDDLLTETRMRVSWKANRVRYESWGEAKQQCVNTTTGQGAFCGLLIRTATRRASIKPHHNFAAMFQKHLIVRLML